MAIKGVILAAGSGAKLGKIVSPFNKHPFAKGACPVGNRRIIDFPIEAAKRAGINEIWINLYYHAPTIRDYGGIDIHRHSGVKINFKIEDQLYGTAGSVKNFVNENGGLEPDDTVVVQNGDIVHNINLRPVIEAHINREAAATIVVNPISNWDEMRNFGSVKLKGMKNREEFGSPEEFEEYIEKFYQDHKDGEDKIFVVEDYEEKFPREICLSNLNDSSIYVLSGRLILDFLPLIRLPEKGAEETEGKYFYQFHHVFKWVLQNKDKYSFYAYLMPEKEGNVKIYWRDVGTPQKLWQANMDILEGEIDAGLKAAAGKFWHEKPWGWMGNGVIFEDPSTFKVVNKPGSISIIGDNVKIGKNITIVNSIIGSGTIIEEGMVVRKEKDATAIRDEEKDATVVRSIIFPSSNPQEPNVIGMYSKIKDSLFIGGKLDPGNEVTESLIYTPESNVNKIPLKIAHVLSIDEKDQLVREKLQGSVLEEGMISMCLENMPYKHLRCASPERLSNQILKINRVLGEFNGGTVPIIIGDNNAASDCAEIIIVAQDTPGLLGKYAGRIGRSSLSIITEWGITKGNTAVLIFEVRNANNQKPSDEEIEQNLKQLPLWESTK
ncbi:MAG: sugar phosphate nucleotidyltransferase [bacterium]